jgi:hypothetical protein
VQNYLSVISRWLLCSGRLLAPGAVGCDQDPEVVAHHAPANPALHTIGAAIKAACETVAPFHDADATLASCAYPLAAAKPALMLLGTLCGRELSYGRYAHSGDAGAVGHLLMAR